MPHVSSVCNYLNDYIHGHLTSLAFDETAFAPTNVGLSQPGTNPNSFGLQLPLTPGGRCLEILRTEVPTHLKGKRTA